MFGFLRIFGRKKGEAEIIDGHQPISPAGEVTQRRHQPTPVSGDAPSVIYGTGYTPVYGGPASYSAPSCSFGGGSSGGGDGGGGGGASCS
jgi:hypothetical protein